jgi:N-acetylmuramoyl-L-alanine amidase
MKKPTICVDAGHGGHDPGAVGPSGLQESFCALDVALRLEKILLPHFNVIMTRRDDRFHLLQRRCEIANNAEADLFISIHCNSGPPGQGSGFEVWTSPGQTESDKAATHQYDAYADKFPAKPRRMDMTDGDVDKESKFWVLVGTKMPATLFELEFIHTPTGEDWLNQEKNRQAAAEALADGILDYFGIVVDLDKEETRGQKPEAREEAFPDRPERTTGTLSPEAEVNVDAAMAWQRMVAGGPMEAQVAAASPKLLIDLRAFLSAQQPHGLISLGLGMVENEIIERFIKANS